MSHNVLVPTSRFATAPIGRFAPTSTGRFAPSPTGALHLGNLRTALIAYHRARALGGAFLLRVEDLDRVACRVEHEQSQLADLAAIGITSDGPIMRQSERFDVYHSIIDALTAQGLTYPCFCTRKEIAEAVVAPHGLGSEGMYPGTCTNLTRVQLDERSASGRPPALRLRSPVDHATFTEPTGIVTGPVDDFVIRRNDGAPAYNLAVVADDAAQNVTDIVRGEDLRFTTPRQVVLQQLLGYLTPRYVHVPLVYGPDGERLAKRHGAVTLEDLAAKGISATDVRQLLDDSITEPLSSWTIPAGLF